MDKENAELRAKLEASEKLRDYWKGSAFDWRHKFFEKKSTKLLVKKSKQLTHAKNLITRLSACFSSYSENIFEKELLKEAKQFLEETE